MGLNPTKDLKAFKRTYAKTGNIRQSALDAGYSQNSANMGITALPQTLVKYVESRKKRLDKLALLARSVTPEQQEDLLRGAIFDNIASGKDKACNSIRLGMQDKRVSMLQADTQIGIIVVNPPASITEAIQKRAEALQGTSLVTPTKD